MLPFQLNKGGGSNKSLGGYFVKTIQIIMCLDEKKKKRNYYGTKMAPQSWTPDKNKAWKKAYKWSKFINRGLPYSDFFLIFFFQVHFWSKTKLFCILFPTLNFKKGALKADGLLKFFRTKAIMNIHSMTHFQNKSPDL